MSLTTTLLIAGACLNGTNLDSTFQKCALQPFECETSHSFRTSRWLVVNNRADILTLCAAQQSIRKLNSVGRCNNSADRYICTSDKSACRFSRSFSPFVLDCNLIDDYLPSNPFPTSHYGSCQSNTPSIPSFCAWKSSECIGSVYSFRSADAFFANSLPDCRCDDVVVGACQSTNDPSQYYCAVSEDVCTSDTEEHQYLPALSVQERLRTTCKLCDTLPPPTKTSFVAAGACLAAGSNTFVSCALDPSDCDGGNTFVSSNAITSGVVSTPSEAMKCLTQRSVQESSVGRCTASVDNSLCVSDKSACRISLGFKKDPQCGVVYDLQPGNRFSTTHYGHCSTTLHYEPGAKSFCAWRSGDCGTSTPGAATMYWHFADVGMSNTIPECRCDDVRTGACVSSSDPRQGFCAVGPAVCEGGFVFYSVRDLETLTFNGEGPNIVCYLCEPLPDPAPIVAPTRMPQAPPSNAPVSNPVIRLPTTIPVSSPRPPSPTAPVTAPVFRPPISITVPTTSTTPASTASIQGGALAAIIVFPVIAVVLGSILVALRIKAQRRKQRSSKEASDGQRSETTPDSHVPVELIVEDELIPQDDKDLD